MWKIILIILAVALFGPIVFTLIGQVFEYIGYAFTWLGKLLDWTGFSGLF